MGNRISEEAARAAAQAALEALRENSGTQQQVTVPPAGQEPTPVDSDGFALTDSQNSLTSEGMQGSGARGINRHGDLAVTSNIPDVDGNYEQDQVLASHLFGSMFMIDDQLALADAGSVDAVEAVDSDANVEAQKEMVEMILGALKETDTDGLA